MTTAPQSLVEALQSAVVDKLKADAGVKALVGVKVYDEAPSDKDRPQAPYIYLGPVNLSRPADLGNCIGGVRAVRFRLFAVSTEFGRLEAWAVIEACIACLDNSELTLAAPYASLGNDTQLVSAGDVIAPVSPKSAFADFSDTLTTL